MAFDIAAESLPRRTSKTRKVRTESSIEAPEAGAMPEGTLWADSGLVEIGDGSMVS